VYPLKYQQSKCSLAFKMINKMNIKNKLKNLAMALCFAGLLASSSAQAALTLYFSPSGSTAGDSGITGLVTQNVDDSASNEKVNGYSVPSTGVTTMDYLVPLSDLNPAHFQYGWVAYYNSTGSTLEDLVHFDNSYGITVGNTTTAYDSMFVYSGSTLSDISSTVLDSILGYTYLDKIDQNQDGSFPLYTPDTSFAPGLSVLGPTVVGSFQLVGAVPEPTTILSGALLLLPLGVSAVRILRRNRMA